MLVEIEESEVTEYKKFCQNHNTKPSIPIDRDDCIMVDLPEYLVFSFICFLEIGED